MAYLKKGAKVLGYRVFCANACEMLIEMELNFNFPLHARTLKDQKRFAKDRLMTGEQPSSVPGFISGAEINRH